jgi:hypothetical protein
MTRLAAVPLFSLTIQAVMPMTMTDEIQMRRLVAMRMGDNLLRLWTAVLSRVVPKAILEVVGSRCLMLFVDVDLQIMGIVRCHDFKTRAEST